MAFLYDRKHSNSHSAFSCCLSDTGGYIQQDTEEYLNQRGTSIGVFSGVKKGDKGRGEDGRGPKAHSKNSDFGTPMI